MPPRRALLFTVSTAAGLAASIGWSRHVAGASGRRLRAVAAGSPHATHGIFANPEPGEHRPVTSVRTLTRMARHRNELGVPAGPVPLAPVHVPAHAADLAATWLGHASTLLEVDGRRVLTDPVWSTRVTPVALIGPHRLHPPVESLSVVGRGLDVVLMSHDHYDHLDRQAVRRLARETSATFVTPVGVGEHLRAWGVPAERIVQRDWGGSADVAGLRFTCLRARHFSGRWLRRNTTQWGAWSVAGPRHRVYFGGDTGPTRAFGDSGTAYGPFDLTLLPIGAYSPLWPDIHTTPEQAVEAHLALRGGVLLPIHWATFNLGHHSWSEPVERLRRAAADAGVRTALPRIGERTDMTGPLPARDWWSSADRPAR